MEGGKDSQQGLILRQPPRTFRVGCSLLSGLSGICALWMVAHLSHFEEIFENTVTGGVRALPLIPRLLLLQRIPLLGVVAVMLIMTQVIIWKSGRENQILIVTIILTIVFLALTVVSPLVMQPLLRLIIDKFGP